MDTDDPCVPQPNRSSHLDERAERPSHSRPLMATPGQPEARGQRDAAGIKSEQSVVLL